MNEKPTSRDHRLALGLCIVLALLLAGGPVGVWLVRSARQQQAVRAIKGLHSASVWYAYELDDNLEHIDDPPPGPDWVRSRLGIDFVTTVRGVHISYFSDAGLAQLQNFPQLRLLVLNGSVALAGGFEPLEKLEQLEELVLSNDIKIDEHAFAVLPKLPRLRTVRIYNCDALTDAGLDEISQIAGLTTFRLQQGRKITNRGMGRLGGLPKLSVLEIHFTGLLTDDVLRQLASAPNLRELGLGYGGTRPVGGLKYLDRFAALEEFEIAESVYLVDDDLLELPPLPNLKSFFLSQCKLITPRGLACLERMPNLERLDLRWITVDDAMLASIGQLKQLRNLKLDDCVGLSEAALAHLAGLDRLETLYLYKRDSGHIDPTAIAALRKSLPHCEIWYDDAE